MDKKKVVVIFGGANTEYYASCDSVGGMLDYIDRDLFEVLQLGVTIEGDWILTQATAEEVKDGVSWLKREDNKKAIISPVKNENAILVFEGDKVRREPIDCVFPLISGYGGEDGTLQGLLELSNIPYVGSAVAASANAMDKHLTRLFVDDCGLKQPRCVVVRTKEYRADGEAVKEKIDFDYPIFVKPASLGSSVGISKADNDEELEAAIEEAFKYEDKILIEEGIQGSELKVAVLGNDDLEMGAICEIVVPKGVVNDYATKHINFSSTKTIPADLDEALVEEVKAQSAAIYKALDCKGFARVDFFLNEDGELYFNEINTVPGIARHSIYSIMFEKGGKPFTEMLTQLINLSFNAGKQVSETSQESFKDFI